LAKLRKPAQANTVFTRTEAAVERASVRLEERLGVVLERASESGAERTRNLESISDPELRKSAAQK
jgi:hypothetical protein